MAEPERGPERGTTRRPLSRFEQRLSSGLERTARVLTWLVAVLLLLFVAMALVGAVVASIEPLREHDLTRAVIDGVDASFLVIILLELVRTTLSRGPILEQLQEFLLIGITAAVRSGLEIAAARGVEGRSVATSLAINAGAVLVLVGAFWLIRHRPDADLRA